MLINHVNPCNVRQWRFAKLIACRVVSHSPQILAHLNVLKYSDSLLAKIEAHIELPSGSEEEVELRAVTIQAVEQVKDVSLADSNAVALDSIHALIAIIVALQSLLLHACLS
jgi:Potential Queuosine, Q, salvage protein family